MPTASAAGIDPFYSALLAGRALCGESGLALVNQIEKMTARMCAFVANRDCCIGQDQLPLPVGQITGTAILS